MKKLLLAAMIVAIGLAPALAAAQGVAVQVLAVQLAAAARALEAVRGRPGAAVPQAADDVLVAAAVLPDRAVAAE
jgi:hypothetical protein